MFDKNVTIGYIATVLPKSMEYFKELGIDFCCGGNRILSEVLKEKQIDENLTFDHLNKLAEATKQFQNDFTSMSPSALSQYIVDVHHGYLYKTLPEIQRLLTAVMRAHGEHHKELFQVGKLFGTLRAELEQHLLREEMFLFPAIEQGNALEASVLTPDIIEEHEMAGKILEQLSEITQGYKIPDDACETYAKLYQLIPEMEYDLHRHIHLENNILLKKYDIR